MFVFNNAELAAAPKIDAMISDVDHLTRIFTADKVERTEAISQLNDCYANPRSTFEMMDNAQLAEAITTTFTNWHYIGDIN